MAKKARKCYYNDILCKGKVTYNYGFGEYLCERCSKETDSYLEDARLDTDYKIGER